MAKYGRFKYSERLYGGDKWIYDRSQSDLDMNTEYAYINYWDLNRIETRTQELIDRVTDDNPYKWVAETLTTKTDWGKVTALNYKTNTPISTHTERIISNILWLWRYVYDMNNGKYAYHYRKIPASMAYLDINGMNNLELALYYMHLVAEGIE